MKKKESAKAKEEAIINEMVKTEGSVITKEVAKAKEEVIINEAVKTEEVVKTKESVNTNEKIEKKVKKHSKLRLVSQILFFLLIGLIATNHYLSETGRNLPLIGAISLHGMCPYGGVETSVAFFKYDMFIQKIHASSVVIMVLILGLGVLFGPVVCSFMCPLGSIQEWIGKIGKKIFKKKYNHFMPIKLDKILRYLRYAVLIYTVYLTTNSLRLVFLEVDPYYALFNFWSDEATIGGIIVLVIVLLSSLFIERAWCKYACPFGALIGLTNKFSVFKIRRNASSCISCGLCSHACPMNIEVESKTVITDHQCIRCLECATDVSCPVSNTADMKITSYKEAKDEN
ncbi:MAG: 4Fe-4S binding protein [Vallitaleaceae bacterium]|jgi:Pyruvate/2-oxoacid:ferredoxin oxidoreductase delta subunit|nr:4Fe-4S binding protein [Vallitaleaceae bacterium]